MRLKSPVIAVIAIAACFSCSASAQDLRLGDMLQLGPDVELPPEILDTPLDSFVRQASDSSPIELSLTGSTLADQLAQIRPDESGADEAVSSGEESARGIRPKILRDADQPAEQLPLLEMLEDHTNPLFVAPGLGYPYGFTGPSGVLPSEFQTSSHFIPVEDRWRLGLEDSDRYGKGHPLMDGYLGVKGAWWDPYNQNVLKGDYPIIGQHTFLNITANNLTLFEGRQLPTPTTPFEATRNPGAAGFFGDPDQFLFINQTSLGD